MSTITFRALQVANEHRNAYGLRYSDHPRYRKHCANRTHRLRSALKMGHGKGREFKKSPPINLESITANHLQLLLFEAERAWSYAQDLSTQSANPKNVDKAHALRHSATGRFRRSTNWATQLQSHCQSLYSSGRMSAENLIEVTIYVLILNGRFLRYRDDFEDALPQLSVARVLLDQLASYAQTSRDQALASLFSDEITPEIRYCAHQLGQANSYDVDSISKSVAAQNRKNLVEGYDTLVGALKSSSSSSAGQKVHKLKEMSWENKPVPIRNPELVDAFLKVQEAEARLSNLSGGEGEKRTASGSKKEVALYDAVLLSLSETEETARKLSESSVSSGAAASAPGTRDIQFVHAFVMYQLLARRIQRDMLLVSSLLSSQKKQGRTTTTSLQKPKTILMDARVYPALIKLLDTVLQSLEQIRPLNIVDDSPDLASAVEARIAFTKAQRCYYLSQSYAQAKSYAEALVLAQRGAIYLREARSLMSLYTEDSITSFQPAFYDLPIKTLDEQDRQLGDFNFQTRKDWFAYNGGSTKQDNTGYKKPLFFNIALNYAECDIDRLLERAGKPPAVPAPAELKNVDVPEKKVVSKIADQPSRAATPEPQNLASEGSRGGLSSLLGGWWGRS